jgi:hypothetical protein
MLRKWRLPAIIAVTAALLLANQAAAGASDRTQPDPVGVTELSKLVAGGGPHGASKLARGAPTGTFSVSAGAAVAPDAGCNLAFNKNITEFPQSDGGVSVSIIFSSTIDCSFDVSFDGASFLLNRTQPYSGQIIAAGNEVFGSGGATSTGVFFIGDVYPGANDVETVFAAYLSSPFGWDSCNDSPGVRVLRCEIDPNDPTLLYAELGSGPYSSKKKDPTTTPNPTAVPFYRVWNPTTGDHFLTTDPNEVQSAQQCCGYVYEGVRATVSAVPGTGLVPFYRLWNPTTGDHFHTTDPNEVQTAQQCCGYQSEGIRAYVYPANSANGVPLYRLWNPTTGDHFHTTDPNEVQSAQQCCGYVNEGVRARVLS